MCVVANEDREPVVIEESYPGVSAVVQSHETRRESEQSEAKQFDRWKQDKAEKEDQEKLELERECESRNLSGKERQLFVQLHRRKKQAEAEVKVYERYMRNSCGVLEVTTDSSHGKETKRVILPKTRDGIAGRVVGFSLNT